MAVVLGHGGNLPTYALGPTGASNEVFRAVNVAVTVTSTQSATLVPSNFPATGQKVNRYLVRLCSSVNSRVLVGTNPTALATSPYLPANVVETIDIAAGELIAVIRDSTATADGVLSVTVCPVWDKQGSITA